MSRSKNNKTQKKDGNHRAETKEEKSERLRQQAEARDACFKILPMVGGGVLIFMLLFGLYVNSVPPKAPKPKTSPAMTPADGPEAAAAEAQRLLQEAMADGSFKAEDGWTFTPEGEGEGEEAPAEAPDLNDASDSSEEHVEL